MKNIYIQESDYSNLLISRNSKYDGVKSLLYFILMLALIFSMFFLPDKIYAKDIMFGAQITNKANLSGILSVRFLKDFEASDMYIIAYPDSSNLDKDKIFSFTMLDNDPRKMAWKNQVSIFSTYSCINAGKWGYLSSIDFTPLKDYINEYDSIVCAILLVKNGGDPLNSSDWIDSAVTSLIIDASQRVPGQIDFSTDQSNDRYYPAVEDIDTSPSEEPDKDDDTAEVDKPDIYKISGNKLFYANGSAGRFQVVDISNPNSPNLIHSEYLKHTPLDLYVNSNYVILLEQISEQNDISVILKVFDVQGDNITKIAEQAYSNIQYTASRKSGKNIFITGTVPYYYSYDDTADDSESEGSSLVLAVDISNPASPLLLSKKNLEGYDSDIYINSDYLVQIARVSWDTTILNLFDLNKDDPLTTIAEIKIPGRVPSEYHVNISDNALFVIYRDQDITKGSSLKIFDITKKIDGDDNVIEKGSVNGIAPGEELFAGTFMDNRAYIVTYERKDPLWVVDIADHEAPKIMGELEVPGWSEYIRFYENRLLALGYDDSDGKRRVSVALFSVEDPLKPLLLDRVTPLSGISDYTYSVAIDDDRGFYWNTSSGIIMVPISYYSDGYNYGNYSGLSVIHVDSEWNSFKQNDFIEADFNVQRGTEADLYGSSDALENIAISMGDAALNTIDITYGQKPALLGGLRLAYNVEKISLYENRAVFAIGGDFYTSGVYNSGTSDLMRYDSISVDSKFDFTKPSNIKNSELLYPELLIDKDGFGVIFSWSSAAFRLFDQNTMVMGDRVKIGDTSTWTTSDPIVSKNQLYFAVTTYSYPKDEGYKVDSNVINSKDNGYTEDSYSIKTILKRYDCSDINDPKQLADISIPGTPNAVFNGSRLITVETQRYYYPYYAYESSRRDYKNRDSSIAEPIMPPPDIPDDTKQGTRINAVEIGQNSGVLDKTAFFDQETYGYSEVICDETNIYLVSIKDDETKIHLIDTTTLNIVTSNSIKGSFAPVKAAKGKIVLTSRYYYPYWRYDYKGYMPYWNNSEIKVLDVSGGNFSEVAAFSSDIYASKNNTIITDNGIYISKGYRGIIYFSFSN